MSIYNSNQSVYYVYAYLREDYTPYYIGKGKGKRLYNSRHNVSVPKDKSRIIIIHDNISELQSLLLERYYIRWFGRKDNNTGILRNLTDGGEGISGYKHSEERKQKISAANTGKTRSKELKNKISQKNKGNKHCIGRYISDDTRNKISIGNKGKTHSEETKKKMALRMMGNTYTLGYKHTEETRKKMVLSKVIMVCPHCNKSIDKSNYTRWHGDKCKYKL
jgi:NUMOD3 motif